MYEQAERIVAVSTLFLLLSWIFVALRCFVRVRIVKKFGIDDGLIVLAAVFYTVLCAIVFHGIQYDGFGGHASRGATMKMVFFFYALNTTATKLSVGFLLLRICTVEQKYYRWTLWINMLICTLALISAIPLIFLQCSYKQLMQPNPTCLKPSLGASGLPFSIIDILSEWVFAVLPIILLWNVKIPIKVKISLMAILAMGILASIVCVVYTVWLADAINNKNIYQMSGTLVWAQTKTGLGIVASSAATLRPLFKELRNGRLVGRRFKRITSGASTGMSGTVKTAGTVRTVDTMYLPWDEERDVLEKRPNAVELSESSLSVKQER